MNRNLLILAPHSLPIRSSESISNAKLIFALLEEGYNLNIISSSISNINYPLSSNIYDIERFKNRIKIHTIENDYISKKKSIKDNLLLIIEIVKGFCLTKNYYAGCLWSYRAIFFLKKNNLFFKDRILISRGFYTEIASIYLAKKYRLKWIANWNDPYPEAMFPPPYSKGLETNLNLFYKKIIKEIGKYSFHHTFPNSRLRDYMLKYLVNSGINKTSIIPHIVNIKNSPVDKSNKIKKSYIKIIHAGNLDQFRNPSLFFEALSSLVNFHQIHCVRVSFIGKVNNQFYDYIKKYNLNNYVEFAGEFEYDYVLKLIENSDLSLIIEARCEEGIFLPTKVADSLQCLTPILAISPSIGVLNDMISKYNVGYFADNSSLTSIISTLLKVVNDYINRSIINVDIKELHFLSAEFAVNELNKILLKE